MELNIYVWLIKDRARLQNYSARDVFLWQHRAGASHEARLKAFGDV